MCIDSASCVVVCLPSSQCMKLEVLLFVHCFLYQPYLGTSLGGRYRFSCSYSEFWTLLCHFSEINVPCARCSSILLVWMFVYLEIKSLLLIRFCISKCISCSLSVKLHHRREFVFCITMYSLLPLSLLISYVNSIVLFYLVLYCFVYAFVFVCMYELCVCVYVRV
jgi:hypothetical protein